MAKRKKRAATSRSSRKKRKPLQTSLKSSSRKMLLGVLGSQTHLHVAIDPGGTLDRPGVSLSRKRDPLKNYRRTENRGLTFLNGLTAAPVRRPARFAVVETKTTPQCAA
jgi:hypothetical protein